MKWNKFSGVLAGNPWLRDFIGSANVVSAPHNHPEHKALAMLKDWVRTRLQFVAFRPFEALDTTLTNHQSGEGADYKWEKYQVLIHIEGEPFAHRARSVAWKPEAEEDETSVHKVIEHLVRWHQQYWGKESKKLVFDAVIKTKGQDHSHSIEIFRFPENFGY